VDVGMDMLVTTSDATARAAWPPTCSWPSMWTGW